VPPAAAAGQAVLFAVDWLVEGKFHSLFSMLFGIGFALQAARADARGHDIGLFFRRRMAVLVLIGLTHATRRAAAWRAPRVQCARRQRGAAPDAGTDPPGQLLASPSRQRCDEMPQLDPGRHVSPRAPFLHH
jgi:hypothetical protein